MEKQRACEALDRIARTLGIIREEIAVKDHDRDEFWLSHGEEIADQLEWMWIALVTGPETELIQREMSDAPAF